MISNDQFRIWSLEAKPAWAQSGIFGQSSFQDGPLAASSFAEKSGGGMTAAVGSTRGSLSTRGIGMNDRRSIGRTKIVKDALLFLGEQSGVRSCAVTDITNLGACIHIGGSPVLPLNFELSFDNFRTTRKCLLIWRDRYCAGVVFESGASPIAGAAAG